MYHALYRKYRPTTFDDVVGQEPIIKTLKKEIENNRVSHAYLFFGPRGTGKTTAAKIFARTVNCLDTKEGLACGKCKNCVASKEKECVDIIEIDAASNNGVDEIRNLKTKINLVPAELTYKVYIIDEVHMLTIGAFNALLKTLEEPPAHVIFILATTDFQKVPETIISRCQTFPFKRIDKTVIEKRISEVCKKENINIDNNVIEQISLFCDGGLRDALGMLDKLSSYGKEKITINEFEFLNGLVNEQMLEELTTAIVEKDYKEFLLIIEKINSSGKNIIQVFQQELYYLRNTIVNSYIKNNITELTYQYQNLANELNINMESIKKSSNPTIFIEIEILRYLTENTKKVGQKNEKIISREIITKNNLSKNEAKTHKREYKDDKTAVELNFTKIKSNNTKQISNISEILKVRINNTFATASKSHLTDLTNDFKKLNDFVFDQEKGYLVCDLLDSKIRAAGTDVAIISYEYPAMVEKNMLYLEQLENVFQQFIGKTIKFAIITDSEWTNLKNTYVNNLKSKKKYEILEEPLIIYEQESKKDDIIDTTANLFGSIVEYE